MSEQGTPIPTADEAFGASLPTADQAFGGNEPMSGSFADYAMTQNPFAHVLKSFGQGFESKWGSDPVGLSEDSNKELSKAGVFNDYATGRTNLLKSFNEAVIRPSVGLLDSASRLPGAVLGGLASSLMTASHEEVKLAPKTGVVLGGALAGLGDLAGTAAEGGGLEFAVPQEGHLATARANAAIGEDEAQFFGTRPPNGAQAAARAQAVGELHVQGIQPDIHNVARQFAPETFAHYDAVVEQHDFVSNSLKALQDDRVNDPDAVAAQGKIDSILDRVNGNEEELTETAQEELSKARDEKDAVVEKATPEITELRQRLAELNRHIVNMSPDVRYAYSEAQKALRGPEEPVQAVSTEAGTQVASENQGTLGASQGLSGDVSQKGLTGEIASDVSKKLVSVGRPLEEADAVGQLIEEHYNSRADRFSGKLGTGKDLYDKEFPNVVKAETYKKLVNTLNQAGLKVARKLPDGTVRVGELGQIHAHLVDDFSLEQIKDSDEGFVNPSGEFLSRKEALNWVKENQPEISKKLNFEVNGGLESVRYDIARDLKQDQRGAITLREGRNLIRLFKNADASTFLHETGHQWLEELVKDAQREGAPKDLLDDVETVRKYVKNDGPIFTRAQHEKFARAFERYLREGNAPSRALAGVFQKFKKWLTAIYQKVSQLKAPINDDIRQVFDRLIVTPSKRDLIAPDRKIKSEVTTTGVQSPVSETATQPSEVASPLRDQVPSAQGAPSGVPSEEPATASPTGTPPTDAVAGTLQGAPAVGTTPESPPVGQVGEGTPIASSKTPKVSIEKGLEVETPLQLPPAGNIKIENLTSEGDLQTFIKEFYDEHKEDIDKRRGKISDNDLLDLAEAAGLKASDINVEKLQEMSVNDGIPYSARVLGLRQAFIDSAQNAWEEMKKEPPDELKYAEASQRHLWLQQVLTQVTGEAGRTLRAFKSLQGGKGLLEDAKALSEFFQNNLGKSAAQIQTEMKLGSNLKDVSQVSGFLRDAQKASAGEMLLEFFRNNLISGPITHMTYAAGNKIFALYKAVPERLATAAVGSIRETLTGQTGTERAYAGEAAAALNLNKEDPFGSVFGFLYGQRDGLKAAWDSFKAGQTLPLPSEDLASTPFTRTRAIPGTLGSIVRLPGERMVAPIHSFDRTVGYLTNRAQLIFRQAKSEGLEGEALSQRIAELEKDTPEEITKKAVEEATSQSLMGRPGEPTRRFLSFIRTEFDLPLLGRTQPGSFVAPFISVVSNINRQAFLERGPLGLLSKSFWEDATGKNGTLAQDSSIAKMGLGLAVGGTMAGLLLQGKVTPAASSNYHQATVDEMAQGIPHSIRIGDMSYQFNRLGIVGAMLSMSTDVAYAGKAGLETGDYEKGVSLLLHSLAQTFTQEGMMSGISDLLNAVDDPDRYGQSYVKNMLGSFVPFSVGDAQVAHLMDPYQRDARTWLDSVKNKIPGLTEGLEPKVDIFGQDVPNKEYYGVYAEAVSNDPVVKALKSNGYFPAPVERKINGIALSAEQYHDYAKKAGMVSKMLLNNIVGMPAFSQLSPTTRHDMLRDAVTSGRSAARSWMLMNNPDIVKKSIQMKYDLTHKGE